MRRKTDEKQAVARRNTRQRSAGADWVDAALRWFDAHRRAMPWRDRPSPFRVWVSEIMLQQTQVVTAIPFFTRFMKRFPSIRALATADRQSVLKAWEGLGYYARARNLQEAAKQVVADHRGRLPRTATELLALPGIGPYSAAAIASIAFGEVVPTVDSNVIRLFARFLAITEECTRAPVRRQITETLAAEMSTSRPGDFNQAMMELGALVCRPGQPACSSCPLQPWCAAHAQGLTADLPILPRKKRTPHHDIATCVIRRNGKVLIARRREDQMLGGLWEFPGGKQKDGETLQETGQREIREETGLDIRVGPKLCKVDHAYSHFSITLHTYECEVVRGRARALASDEVRWVPISRLRDYPFPSANHRIIELLSSSADA